MATSTVSRRITPYPLPTFASWKEGHEWRKTVSQLERVLSNLTTPTAMVAYLYQTSPEDVSQILIAMSRKRKDKVAAALTEEQRQSPVYPTLLLSKWLEQIIPIMRQWQLLTTQDQLGLWQGDSRFVRRTCFYLTYTIIYGFYTDALAFDLKDVGITDDGTDLTIRIRSYLAQQLDWLDRTLRECFGRYAELELTRDDVKSVKTQALSLKDGMALLCDKLQLSASLGNPAKGLMWNSRTIMLSWAVNKLKEPVAA